MERDILSVEQVSEYLGLGERTVYKLLKEGSLPAVKVKNRWLFRKESLDEWFQQREKGKPSPTEDKRRVDLHSIREAFDIIDKTLNSIMDGAVRNGIENIYLPRRQSDQVKKAISGLIERGRGEVLLAGVSLRQFFGNQDFNHIIWQKLDDDVNFHIKALLVDPASDVARARAVAEQGREFGEEKYRESVLFADLQRSVSVLESLQEAAKSKKNFKIEAKFFGCTPVAFLVATHEAMVIEQYHFGHEVARAGRGCIGELVPLIEVSVNAPYYEVMKNHFYHLWEGQNRFIPIRTLKQVYEYIFPGEGKAVERS